MAANRPADGAPSPDELAEQWHLRHDAAHGEDEQADAITNATPEERAAIHAAALAIVNSEAFSRLQWSVTDDEDGPVVMGADIASSLRAVERERDAEIARRKFMQIQGRFLGWGIDPERDNTPRVLLHDQMWDGPYSGGVIAQVYHDGTLEGIAQAERDVIDAGIALESARALSPGAATTEDTHG